MTLTPPKWSARVPRPLVAAVAGALLAVVTVAAQQGIFNEVYEGELFGVQQELATPGYAAGVAYLNDTLYVADGENGNLIVRDASNPLGVPLALNDATGLIPNQLAIVDVDVVTTDGTDGPVTVSQKAILVSDSSVNRVLAFDLGGNRLFTMQLDWPGVSEEYPPSESGDSNVQVINGMAMAPGSRFVLSTTADGPTSLDVVGTFAAGWAVDFGQNRPGALLVYPGASAQYVALDDDFKLTPDQALTDGGMTNEAFGVAFDSFGNLYLADSFRYTITAYGLNGTSGMFEHLLTYGTPLVGGEVEQFYEPYGLAFWPDASDPAGGRLFVADAINNRIVAYRSNATALAPRPSALNPLFAIEIPDDTQPYAVAVDPPTGKVATSDASSFPDDPSTPLIDESGEPRRRVWVLQTRNLVAFNLQVLDATGVPVGSVCSGAPYSVRFSLTVPATRPTVYGATPILTVDGNLIDGINVGPVDLAALQTQTYTYSLTAPGSEAAPQVVELPILADATATSTTDVLARTGTVSVRDCSGTAPTISATPSIQPQLSGWTPVFASPGFRITLAAAATDDSNIEHIEYDLFGANQFGYEIPPVINSPLGPTQVTFVPLVEMGNTTIKFRALSTKNFPSTEDWLADPCTTDHCLAVWLVDVKHLAGSEGQVVAPFTVGPPQLSTLTYSAAGLPPGITFNPATGVFEGTLSYNAAGVHTVVMTESDGTNVSQWAFTWTVANVNRVPVALIESYETNEDGTLTVNAPGVLGNDTDPDGTELTTFLEGSASHGTLTLNQNGSFTYAPTADYHGVDAFTYRAYDDSAYSNPATVTITVASVNDAPLAAGDDLDATEDTAVTFAASALLANDTDVDGDVLTIAQVTSVTGGTATLNPDGTVTFVPTANFSGAATFTYTATDGVLTSDPATVTVTVDPVNDAPVAADATASMTEDGTLNGTLPPATDPDSSSLTYATASDPDHGTVTVAEDGTYTYTPAADFSGTDTFTYTVTDGALTSAPATVTVTVAAVNDAPSFTKGADQVVLEDAAEQIISGWATGVSAGPGESTQTLTFLVSSTNPALFSTLAVSTDGTLTYRPAPNAFGVATVTVRLKDDGGTANGGIDTSEPQTFTITVTDVGDAPVAVPDTIGTNEDTPVTHDVLGNDEDADDDSLTIVSITQPAATTGIVVVNGDWTLTFTPVANFNGTDTFTYTVTDGQFTIGPVTVTVSVAGVNDAPVAVADALDATEDTLVTYAAAALLANDADVDGDALTIAQVTSGTGGTATLNPDGTVTFVPTADFSGAATFTYTATDGNLTSNTVTVTVTVAGVNDAPMVVGDTYSVVEDTALVVAAPGVLANDSDVESASLSAILVAGPTHGTLTLNGDGSFAYTPDAGYIGSDQFTYKANDGSADSTVSATVSISVTARNGPPVCSATVTPALIWPPNHRKVYLSLAGITDPNDDELTIRFTGILQDEPTNTPGQGNTMQDGGIEANGARAWVRAERTGGGDGRVYLVSFTATDPSGASCAGEVTVGVPHDQSDPAAVASPGRWNSLTGQLVSAPPAPVAMDDAVTGPKGGQFKIAVQANDVAYGLPLTVSIANKPSKGKATVNSDGTITYKAPSNWTGTTSFTYAVSNGVGGVDTAVVTVTVVNQSAGNDDDDDCGDRNHDHRNDRDRRDRDHRDGDHDRCRHS